MALSFGCKRNSNSAPAMTTPVPPRRKSPLAKLTTSPRTCVAMITTASLHPQRRRRNHPIPAVVRAAHRKRIPTVPPRGASCLYAIGLRAHRRSRTVPRQSKVVAAMTRHEGTKEQENAYRSESWRFRPDSEIEAAAIDVPHLLNISQRHNMIRLLAKDQSAAIKHLSGCGSARSRPVKDAFCSYLLPVSVMLLQISV